MGKRHLKNPELYYYSILTFSNFVFSHLFSLLSLQLPADKSGTSNWLDVSTKSNKIVEKVFLSPFLQNLFLCNDR